MSSSFYEFLQAIDAMPKICDVTMRYNMFSSFYEFLQAIETIDAMPKICDVTMRYNMSSSFYEFLQAIEIIDAMPKSTEIVMSGQPQPIHVGTASTHGSESWVHCGQFR